MGETVAAISAALESIQLSLRDVSLRGRPLRDRVAIDLARAEATRARWMADAATVLQTDPLPSLDEVDLAAVCRSVAEAFAPEYRLSGGAPAMTMPPGAAPVFGDERLLTAAVGSILAAVRALVEDRGDASRVVVTLAPRADTANRTLAITQTAVRLPASAHARFFDPSWTDHPAGATAALLLAAAHRIAEAHGGALELAAVDGGGCRLSLSVPAAG
jgi:signal transduction histidine kinase